MGSPAGYGKFPMTPHPIRARYHVVSLRLQRATPFRSLRLPAPARVSPALPHALAPPPSRRACPVAPCTTRQPPNPHRVNFRPSTLVFGLITNRSCKPLSGRYYREHSDGVDRRFSRGRQGLAPRAISTASSHGVPVGSRPQRIAARAGSGTVLGQPAATCASRSLSDWCPPTAAAP